MTSNFVDYVKICCRSGKGGGGSVHLARFKGNPKGGPDGGDGGRGGHIILKGNSQVWTLLHLKYTKHVFAKPGENGGSNLMHGANGENAILEVPLGTVCKDAETGEVMCEIIENDQEIIVLEGGQGGLGNDHFKSATNRTPRYAQPGGDEIERWLILELKLLADVGLVGFPNAGKSTLLSVISAARPEIADYPFTTLVPNLGVVSYRDDKSFVVSDIPGIIEGASEGKGLGLRFLRHIERNAVLLFMIPCDSDRTIEEEYRILLQELKQYNPELVHKQRLIAITKCDIIDDVMMEQMTPQLPKDIPCLFISSVSQRGIMKLKDAIWNTLNAAVV